MYKYIITYFFIIFPVFVFSQETNNNDVRNLNTFVADSILKTYMMPDTIPTSYMVPDSILTSYFASDTFAIGTLQADSTVPAVIEAPIVYNAEDSIIVSFDGQKVYLYNNAKVTYQNIELTAYHIELDLETKEVYAEGILDSTETLVQKPVFNDGGEQFDCKTLRYNFQTQKGIIADVVTEQGEGFIHSERTKKISNEAFLMKNGMYTTCDAEHPHFYLHLSKAKVISNNKIVTGPAYLVLEDFPIYFPFLPFGYFPSSPTYSSGIIVPSYGEEANRGFFLQDGGYYWAASDYFDVSVRADIYSRGSWGTKFHTNYRKKYKFSGGFDFKYAVNKYGEKGLDTYQKSNQFSIAWNHSQDSKANPNQTFSASVNFSTSGYDRQNSYSANDYLTTTKSSSISFTKKIENSPFNMSVNLRHSQNSSDSTITLTMPELTFSMAKIYPLKRKNQTGPVKWYQNFGVNYTGNMRNTITAKESEILNKSLINDWQNGIRHNIPISLPGFNLFNYFNFSPGISYNEKWYFRKYNYNYNPDEYYYNENGDSSFVHVGTVSGLNRVYDYAYSLSTSTNIYGNYIPLNPNSRIKGIRHKMTPSVSFSYRPDFGAERFGYWQAVQVDSTGRIDFFDVNEGGIYGGSPGRGASGSINFSLTNNIEMKVLDVPRGNKNETQGSAQGEEAASDENENEEKYKKVKIIDNIGFTGSYNLVADSLNFSTIGLNARTTIKGVNVNASGTLDPYMINEKGTRINKFTWNERNGFSKLGRLTRASLSFGMQFRSKKGEKEAETNKELIEGEGNILPGEYSDYVDFNIPWDFSFDYSFNYSGPTKLGDKGKIMQTLGMRGNLSLTEKWHLTMNTNFDIMAREFSFTTFNVTRDLHCWQMVFNFVPFGFRKSYSFTLNASSSILKDLKISKNRSYYDNL